MKTGRKAHIVKAMVSLILCMVTATVGSDRGSAQPPKVLGSIGSVRPIVAAFYYPWYGTPTFNGQWVHWEQNNHLPPQDIGSDYYPLLGAYSSRDPSVLAQHMAWLQQAGIQLIIVSWWGQGSREDQAIPGLLAQAANYGIKVAFHIEPYFGRSADRLVDDVEYLYASYGNSPAFFRTKRTSRHSPNNNPKGIFFLWGTGIQFFEGPSVDAAYWRPAIDQIHALPDGGLVFADQPDAALIDAGHFDGEYSSSINPWPDGWEQALISWANSLPHDAWFIPSATPGFSANRVGYPAETYRPRDEGRTYDEQWRAMLETGVTPHIVSITTFNEWHEGTQIEPAAQGMTDGYGYTYAAYTLGPTQYLSATAQWVHAMHEMLVPLCTEAVSVTLKARNISRGLYQHDWEDGLTEPAVIGGRETRRAIPNVPGFVHFVYFWVNNDFHSSARGSIRVSVEFYDAGKGSLWLDYDSTDASLPFGGAYKKSSEVHFTGTNQWRTATFDLPDAFLGSRQNGGADFRIGGLGTYYISRVTVSKQQFICRRQYLPSRLFAR